MAVIKKTKVRLRIVGVFYDEMITVEKDGKVTVKDVLDEAEKSSLETFRYRAEERYSKRYAGRVLSLSSFTHKITTLDPSLGARKRAAGIYEIRETVDPINGNEIVHAWQYYVISGGKAVSNASDGKDPFDVSPASPKNSTISPKAVAGFTPFDRQEVVNNDEIVWRNVSIARGPTTTREIE